MTNSVTKVGSEFLVNTQAFSDQDTPAITGLSNGGFVVTWRDTSGTLGDASSWSIKAQVFAADGSKVGSEFLVNTQTESVQAVPTITALSNGGFVVAWSDQSGTLGDSSETSVKAQVFAADGSKVGSEFLVNTQTANIQAVPAITALSNGGFVVSWSDQSGTLGDSSASSIKAQVFAADGSKVGTEFLVNTQTASTQAEPAITTLSNGGFVVAWQDSSGTLGDGFAPGIKAQVFAADGSKVGTEFLVNTATVAQQLQPTIASLSSGGFVVTWHDRSQSLGDFILGSIKAQVFAADGSKVGSEFLVNTQIGDEQFAPTVTGLSNGGFIITWTDAFGFPQGDASGTSVKAQVFAADGSKVGTEFLVNTQTLGSQGVSTITELSDGRLVVTWVDSQRAGRR